MFALLILVTAAFYYDKQDFAVFVVHGGRWKRHDWKMTGN